jgi:hypothetical protein
MDLDFKNIDLIFENAQLRLELMKNDYQFKPEPVVIEKPCSQCQGRSALAEMVEAQRAGALQGNCLNMLNNSQVFTALSGVYMIGAMGQTSIGYEQ